MREIEEKEKRYEEYRALTKEEEKEYYKNLFISYVKYGNSVSGDWMDHNEIPLSEAELCYKFVPLNKQFIKNVLYYFRQRRYNNMTKMQIIYRIVFYEKYN